METNKKLDHQLVDLPWKGGDGEITDAVVIDEKEGITLHKDIGSIEATELDGITVNRTKSKLDPFVSNAAASVLRHVALALEERL